MAELWNLVLKQNPWWQEKGFRFPEGSWPKREIYQETKKLLTPDLMVAVNGLRRTGKTTILRQLINELLDQNKFNPRRLCYFSFEEAGVAQKTEVLEELIETFLVQVLGQQVFQLKNKVYLFLDEVQFVPLWPVILKRYYDLNKNFKFVISGSSSLFLREESKESLAGRLAEILLYPLSFGEFLELRHQKKDLYSKLTLSLFHQFLATGQFPEIVNWPDFPQKRAYLKEWVVDRVLERDLPRVLKISSPEDLKGLAYVLMEGSAGLVEFSNLAKDLGISRETVRNYSGFLQKALLVSQVLNTAGSFRRRERRQRKIYAQSSNFLSVIWGEDHLGEKFSSNLGRIVETYVAYLLKWKFGEVFFWRERGKEIDFVVKHQGGILPIEVKYQTKISASDLDFLVRLTAKKKIKKSVVLTRGLEEVRRIDGQEIFLLPAWKMEELPEFLAQ